MLSLQSTNKNENIAIIEQPIYDQTQELTYIDEEILDNSKHEEVVNDGVNDGIKRLVYSGRNG